MSGTTARCASELVGIHRNTSIVYFCRLREIIAYQLELKITEYFSGDIAVMKAISAEGARENEVVEQVVTPLYLACLKGAVSLH